MMIENWVDENFHKLVEIRRWLHQHPEVGFDEHETSQYCQKFMKDLGFEIHQTENWFLLRLRDWEWFHIGCPL